MNKRNSVLLAGIAVLVTIYGALTWYKSAHSMRLAHAFEIGTATAERRVLIASQGSDFKDKLVIDLAEQLKSRGVYVRVIDVSKLASIDESQWSAIVVLHTWEIGKPQRDAARFVESVASKRKLIAIATSGSGQEKLTTAGVDVLSSASQMSDEPKLMQQVMAKLDVLLASAPSKP